MKKNWHYFSVPRKEIYYLETNFKESKTQTHSFVLADVKRSAEIDYVSLVNRQTVASNLLHPVKKLEFTDSEIYTLALTVPHGETIWS